MTDNKLRLSQPPFSAEHSDLNNLRKDPPVCDVCLNLCPGTAASCYPRYGLWRRTSLGVTDWMQNAKVVGDIDTPSAWVNSLHREDYDGWVVAASLHNISIKASQGCGSCAIVNRAVMALRPNQDSNVSKHDEHLRVYMMFRKGNVLRLSVCRVHEAEDQQANSDYLFTGLFDEVIGDDGLIEDMEEFELYTIPGKLKVIVSC